ncbi:MAG: hypothetical protein GX488_08480, partial [Clostridiales bacterium]|nr:hypothetical protein [Clostridiales bacterium]
VKVLCEGYDEETGLQFGRSYADSPDIDGIVFFSGACPAGEFADIELTDVSDGEWFGRQAEERTDFEK